jgi:hypothetical protein
VLRLGDLDEANSLNREQTANWLSGWALLHIDGQFLHRCELLWVNCLGHSFRREHGASVTWPRDV